MDASTLDLAYVRSHPDNLARLLEHQRIRMTPVTGGDICHAHRLTLDDGTDLFAKTLEPAPPGMFPAEAAGLRWLAEADAVRLPEVIAVTDDLLALEWIEPGHPTPAGMTAFGRDLARLHRAGADNFGAPWPAYVGPLQADNTPKPTWPDYYAENRVRPALRTAVDHGHISRDDARVIDDVLDKMPALTGDPEPPSRLHGDLWSGNLHCASDGEVFLIDPSAYGGHREVDLAMLHLFGAPQLDLIVAAYHDEFPLASDWRDRIALYQLHPLVVHAALFGGTYGPRAAATAHHYR